MRSLYNFLKELNHLEDWHVVKGEETLYPRTEYSQIEIDTLSYNPKIRKQSQWQSQLQ